VGQALAGRLESVDALGFRTPAARAAMPAVADSLAGAQVAGDAQVFLEREVDDASALSVERQEEGLVVLATEVSLESFTIVEQAPAEVVVEYTYLFTRDIPELSEDEDWAEEIPYEVTVANGGDIVDIVKKDLEYLDEHPVEEGSFEETGDFADLENLEGLGLPAEGDSSSIWAPRESVEVVSDPAPQVRDATELEFGTTALTSTGRTKVKDYALKWWNSKNSAYPTHYTNDCTNFVSQALHAGGWSMKSGLWNTNNGWWARTSVKPYSSYPWGGAENFYQFAVNKSGRTTIHRYVYDMRIGDVLQYKSSGSSGKNHTMVATAKASNGMPYLTYHTTNTRNRPFSEMNTSGRTWYVHKV
jgi:hypothetical protein